MTVNAITFQQIARTGLEQTYEAANAGGNSVANDGRVFLHIKNAAVADITVTVDVPGEVDGLAVANRAVVVTAAEERMIGPFPPNIYNQPDGTLLITYSAVTTVTVAALRL